MTIVKNYLTYRFEQLTNFLSQEKSHLRSLRTKHKNIFSNPALFLQDKKVNIHYYRRSDGGNNLGDDLSPIICNYLCHHFGIDRNRELPKTKHLYAIGSILGFGCQNATVWGSGLLEPYRLYKRNLKSAKLDIRAVRGPLTKSYLSEIGIECPSVFGDPAILLPKLYMPDFITKRYEISVIAHYAQNFTIPDHIHPISIQTADYQSFVNELVSSKLIVSSSLHGIILAESYGIPAILWNEQGTIPFKMKDYYFSTNRYDIPVIKTLEDLDRIQPPELPILDTMCTQLLNTFPRDLWEQ